MATEWLDVWWRSLWEEGTGEGGTSVGMYAWNLGMSQYGYIGQYLGAYGAVKSDMADLQHPFSGYDLGREPSPATRSNRRDMDAPISNAEVYDFTGGGDTGSGTSSARLVNDPEATADNSSLPPINQWYEPYLQPPEKTGAPRGEIGLDTGPDRPPPSAEDWLSAAPGSTGRRAQDYSPHGGSSYRPADDWMPPGQRAVYGPGSSSASSADVPNSVPNRPPADGPGTGSAPSPPPPTLIPPSASTSPDVPAAHSSKVITLPEFTVYGKIPFEPAVSVPGAYERAKSVGRIEWPDLVGLARGAWNGLFSATQNLQRLTYERAAGPILDPLITPLMEPLIKRSDRFKLSIAPEEETGALIGEQISENLLFEALPFLPQIAQTGRRVLKGARFADMLLTPVFWFSGAGGIGSRGGRYPRLLRARSAAPVYRFVGWTRITSEAAWARYQAGIGSQWEAVFEISEGGKTRQILVDHVALNARKELSSLVEAKFGNMGQMWIPEREAHILQQARDYLALREALGFKNVRYVVSTPLGADRLNMVFAREFPRAVQDNLLILEFQPMRW